MIETIHSFGYLGIFITIILEIGFMIFPLPADSLLFASGVLAEAGKMNLFTLFSITLVASILSGHIGYFLGKTFGKDRLRHNRFFSIDEAHFNKAHNFFEKYGAVALIFSRFIPIVRSFISPTLGIVSYNKYSFAMYNVVASIIWSATVLMLGYMFGRVFPQLLHYIEIMMIIAFVASALPFAYSAIVKTIHKRKNN